MPTGSNDAWLLTDVVALQTTRAALYLSVAATTAEGSISNVRKHSIPEVPDEVRAEVEPSPDGLTSIRQNSLIIP